MKEGKKQCEIASLLRITPQRVNYHVKKIRNGLLLRTKSLCGRKKIISKELQKDIEQKLEENKFVSGRILSIYVQNTFDIDVSERTIRRMIVERGFAARSPRKVPLISEKNKKKRLKLSRRFLLKPFNDWNRVIWSDETKINLFYSDGKRWVWRKAEEAYKENCKAWW
jgi:transposase